MDITEQSAGNAPKTQLTAEERKAPLKSYKLKHVIEMAQRGHPEAQMKIGFGFSTASWGLPLDHKKGFNWFMKAAQQGNAKAQYNVALSYAKGQGVDRSIEESTRWMKKAAAQGFVPAQEIVETQERAVATQDVIPFIEAFKKKAEKGNKDAAFELAQAYMHGNKGVPKDRVRAIGWYEKAAELGHSEAQFIMSSIVMEKSSNKEKFKWNLLAAKNGHAQAQYNMAIFYGTADDTPFDHKESYAWMRTAIANGLSFPQEDIETVERGVSLFKSEADALAEAYIAKYVKK